MNKTLVLNAFQSPETLGRRHFVSDRTTDPYVLDLISAMNSDIVRRLQIKTQVFDPTIRFVAPVSNRLTHSLSVMAIATEIAQALSLNIHLVQAIAILHDVGHAPISHLGERCISELGGRPFKHAIMSVNMISATMNVSFETLMGVKLHSRGAGELNGDTNNPQEYAAVMYADKIAYIFDDIRDCLEIGFLKSEQLPTVANFLSIQDCIKGLVRESQQEGSVSFLHSDIAHQFAELKAWSYDNIYFKVDKNEERMKRREEMVGVYNFLSANKAILPFEPLTALAIMNDEEVRELNALIPIFNIGHVPCIQNRPWAKLYEKIVGIDIFECSLDPMEFSISR